jgi:outer membrane lipoprotein SlyB
MITPAGILVRYLCHCDASVAELIGPDPSTGSLAGGWIGGAATSWTGPGALVGAGGGAVIGGVIGGGIDWAFKLSDKAALAAANQFDGTHRK